MSNFYINLLRFSSFSERWHWSNFLHHDISHENWNQSSFSLQDALQLKFIKRVV